MRLGEEPLHGLALSPKAIDNSQIVREVDPRAGSELWLMLALVAGLVGGLVLYAWPNLELRRTAQLKEQMSRERERLLEANRKLRLEKSSFENLHRVEVIATRELGLVTPPLDEIVVVERPLAARDVARLASHEPGPGARN